MKRPVLWSIRFVFSTFSVQYAFLKHSDLRNNNKIIPAKLFKFPKLLMRPSIL